MEVGLTEFLEFRLTSFAFLTVRKKYTFVIITNFEIILYLCIITNSKRKGQWESH